MSAFIVSSTHIDALIQAGLRYGMAHQGGSLLSWYINGQRHTLTRETANRVGAVLTAENRRSVDERYDEQEMEDFYTFTPYLGRLDAAQVLKAIHCYEYQACETSDWEQSEAFAFCQALAHRAISHVPGYDTAVWGIPPAEPKRRSA